MWICRWQKDISVLPQNQFHVPQVPHQIIEFIPHLLWWFSVLGLFLHLLYYGFECQDVIFGLSGGEQVTQKTIVVRWWWRKKNDLCDIIVQQKKFKIIVTKWENSTVNAKSIVDHPLHQLWCVSPTIQGIWDKGHKRVQTVHGISHPYPTVIHCQKIE